MRERPALAADVLQVVHLQAHLFVHLARDAMLDRLTRLDEASQRAVDAGDETRGTRQQDFIATGHQHDHARRQARIMLRLARLAAHRPLARYLAGGLTTTAAETVLALPGTDLRGVGQHAEGLGIALQHELAQTLPTAAFQCGRGLYLQQEDRILAEIADALFADDGQILTLDPVTREQHAIAVGQELLTVIQQGPAACLRRIEVGMTPDHQAATDMPRALMLSSARSSTLGWVSGRSTAPASR